MANGLDVSYAQGKPDWGVVKSTGLIDFVYVKASEGLNVSSDVSFRHNWDNLKSNGIPRGAYHFFRPQLNPSLQAKLFHSYVCTLDADDLPPVIDFETQANGMSGIAHAIAVRSFIQEAESLFMRKVVVYTGGPFFNEATKYADEENINFIASHDLWLAAYVQNPEKYVPQAWKLRGKSWSIWQKSGDFDYTGNPGTGYKINGIKTVVDFNVTQGAASDIPTWVASSKISAEDMTCRYYTPRS